MKWVNTAKNNDKWWWCGSKCPWATQLKLSGWRCMCEEIGWWTSQLWGRCCVSVWRCRHWCSWTSIQREEAPTTCVQSGGGGVWGCSTSPCLELAVHWVRCRRGIPTTSYVVLTTGAFCTTPSHSDRGRSEVCQQLRGESSTFELPEEEEPLLGLLHQVGCVCVWTKWGQMYCGCPGTWCLPTLHLLPVDVQKGMFHPPESPDFHSDLLGRAGVHHKVVAWAPSCQVLDLLSSVSNMRPTAVVSSANLTTTLVGGSGSAVMAEQVQRGDFIFYAKS